MSTTNTTTRNSGWPEFRARLFELIESRRAIASTFKHSEIYFFITGCMTAFKSPGSEQAHTSLEAIAETGSFRLVSDSLSDFLAMFPPAVQTPDQGGHSNPTDHAGQAQRTMTQTKSPKEIGSRSGAGQLSREEFQREPSYRGRLSNPPPARRPAEPAETPGRTLQRPFSARPRSGGPF